MMHMNMASISHKFCVHFSSSSLVLILQLLVFSSTTMASFHVKTLPGFSGDLPFYMETGYISVGDVEYFYYFVESQSNPATDPLLLFINGGPGCSALNGFFYEIGPLQFNTENYKGGTPTLVSDPNAWTQVANIIFLDAPVGTGFTYATTTSAWGSSNTLLAQQMNIFIRKWLREHSNFLANPFYMATDSFMGVVNPMIAQNILNGNEAGLLPFVNIKGLSLSCPHTNTNLEVNAITVLAHRLTLISDELYEAARNSCNGNYASTSPSDQCVEDLDAITECKQVINIQNILLPYCAILSPEEEVARRSLGEKSINSFLSRQLRSMHSDFYCKNSAYQMSITWANLEATRVALGIRIGMVERWARCNITLNGYTIDTNDAVPYHKNLTSTGLQLLVFSGDHDMVVPHIAVEQWIKSLGLTVDLSWRPWFVDGQVAGYSVKYSNDGYRLTYATIKGAGHSPPEYYPKQCYNMFSRWIHYYPV